MGRWKAGVRKDFGLDELSQAQATILEVAAGTRTHLREIDDWLAAQDGMTPRVLSAMDQRRRLASSLSCDLERLGRRRGPLARRR